MGVTAAILLLAAPAAEAHVTLWPVESQAGANEKYVVRVPSEGALATTSVELEVPFGVSVVLIGAPAGWTYELKRDGDRVTAIVWTMTILPGEFAEFSFIARNPNATEIVWRAHQYYEDGSVESFTGRRGDPLPSPVTRLHPAR